MPKLEQELLPETYAVYREEDSPADFDEASPQDKVCAAFNYTEAHYGRREAIMRISGRWVS